MLYGVLDDWKRIEPCLTKGEICVSAAFSRCNNLSIYEAVYLRLCTSPKGRCRRRVAKALSQLLLSRMRLEHLDRHRARDHRARLHVPANHVKIKAHLSMPWTYQHRSGPGNHVRPCPRAPQLCRMARKRAFCTPIVTSDDTAISI